MNTSTTATVERDPCGAKKHTIPFFIDQQKFLTDQAKQSPRSLLEFFAAENPTETTLARKVPGHEPHKYLNPDEEIHLIEGMKFVVYHNTPCTVS